MRPKASHVAVACEAMRTRFEIVLADERDPRALRAAGEEALGEIARVEEELSAFRPESMLSRLNAEAANGPVRVDGVTFAFLERCGRLVEALEGAFDPTVGGLMARLRGEQVAEAPVGFSRLVRLDREAQTVAFAAAGVRLDPGAVGKGWALERAAAVLREAGVARALLHGGTSSVYGMGSPGWTVAVQDPADPAGRLARVVLRDQALGVSAIHGRVFRRGEARVGHVVDPRTGEPVAHTVLSAVVTASPMDADAASTALLVLGAEGLARLPERFPGASLLVATAQGKVRRAGRAFEAVSRPPRRRRPAPRARAARRGPSSRGRSPRRGSR